VAGKTSTNAASEFLLNFIEQLRSKTCLWSQIFS